MTPEDIILKFSLNRAQVETVFLKNKKVEYFVEHTETHFLNKEIDNHYDLYFLVTDPLFDQKCDKEKLHDELAKIKKYLYEEGFLDSMVNDTDPDKDWKIHFLVQNQTTPKTDLNLPDEHRKPTSVLWALGKTFIVILLIYSLLKWLLLV